jgi:hypothetical protein
MQRLWFCLLSMALAGCATNRSHDALNQHADAIAASAGLQRATVDSEPFVLTSFYRLTRADQPLTVYIEGDGFAWRSRRQPSDDPTPRKALGLTLAAADSSPNVVYLARPCQFTAMRLNPRCTQAYWTGKRFAEEVVAAMNRAVSNYAASVPGQPLNLVGYSGGGAIAILIAARRNDVASLRTVAGNLDVAQVNRLHKVSAMPQSLDPMDVASRISHIAQIHFSGADDNIVPTPIARHFTEAVGGRCTALRTVPGMSHESDWAQHWSSLLTPAPACRTSVDNSR